jgi:ATP-dependent Lon protease
MELPLDLSEVLFICTANDISQLSAPLRDRLEVIELDGYTLEEKSEIARRHLLPRTVAKHGLEPGRVDIDEDALELVIEGHTREAGVRQLTQKLTKLCRNLALRIARKEVENAHFHLDLATVAEVLGKRRIHPRERELKIGPGVAAGMAWTPAGGDVLFVESSRMPGKGRLQITGQLGDVMQESAKAALTYLRTRADQLGVDLQEFEDTDVHVHVPAGATPKDGPSAGITMFSALASLFSGRRVRNDTVMTGEVTLRGRVLPVGGIKSKVLAAHRAGYTRVLLPNKNEPDIDDLPQAVQDEMEIILVSSVDEVLSEALEDFVTPIGGVQGLEASPPTPAP